MVGLQITVRGRVQGVGFRPFVWRLATDAGLTGHVLNDGTGVRIAAWGPQSAIDHFVHMITQSPPPLAKIVDVETTPLSGATAPQGFHIAQSQDGDINTQITPDAATCISCLADISDPSNRRYRYPFTNCTHCGPRLSIVAGIPYDRQNTSMRDFAMCRDCQREYDDPNDRRFHAQPNACPACGPQLWLEDANGRIDCTDPLAETATRLKQGQIIATKGIGGFHLACDATDPDTVQKLRLRKRRRTKPFAIMAQHVQQIAQYCHLSDAEADLLSTPTAPIVLLETRQENTLPCIAPGLDRIGVMLPHAPVHHILLAEFDGPLVMTSGNLTQAPQITKNDDARRMLLDIADAVLMHDRDIVNRLDDSLIRMDHGAPTLLRRARGLAPSPILLHPDFSDAPPILAMGGELKSTFCLLRNGQAVPSEHIGDLTAAKTYADFREKIIRYSDLYDVTPTLIAADQNPDYLSTRWGQHLAHEIGATLVPVQHHHAHMISCLAEHRVPLGQDKSVGLILDGTGFGTDGTIWGGEILLGGYADFQRKAHLQPIALPGGAQAVREPWRNLVAHLSAAFGQDWEDRVAGTPIAAALAQKPTAMICQMIAQGVNAPLASSAGRMFDAVAAALGVAFDQQHYEGEAAMQLEAMVGSNDITEGYPAARSAKGVISWAPLWSALIADCRAGIDRGTIAARFHFGLADALADAVVTVASNGQTNRIVLSGGVMQNRLLHRHLTVKLQNQGMTVLSPVALPANDGGIALGQACCAAAQAISASN